MKEGTAQSAEVEHLMEAAQKCAARVACYSITEPCPYYDYDHGCEHDFSEIAHVILALGALRRDNS